MRYRNTEGSPAEIARRLDAHSLVDISVSRSTDTVRLNVTVLRTEPREQQDWSGVFRRPVAEISLLHSDVALALARHFDLALSQQETERLSATRRVDDRAFDAWLQGVQHSKRTMAVDLDACIRFARQAISIDSLFAPAHALQARCYANMTFGTASPPREMLELAKAAALKAIALDSANASAHGTLGWVLATGDWNWVDAERAFRRAVAFTPTNEDVHAAFGFFLAWMGEPDSALKYARRAERLSPFSPREAQNVAMVLYLARKHAEARTQARHAIDLDSTHVFGYDRLHWAASASGAHEEALAAAKTASELAGPRDVRRRAFLARAYAAAGRTKEARDILNDLLVLEAQVYVPPTAIAAIYTWLGDADAALQWLEKGFDGKDGDMVLLKTFPLWDPLRSDPRFQELERRMRFP